jgi:hypothetical protein
VGRNKFSVDDYKYQGSTCNRSEYQEDDSECSDLHNVLNTSVLNDSDFRKRPMEDVNHSPHSPVRKNKSNNLKYIYKGGWGGKGRYHW